jgi:5'-nucleotidase
MRPYIVINKDGFDIMFIGIITEEVLNQIRADSSISTFISLEDACEEIGKICNAYKDEDIDLTVLLTHIGFEKDKKLAAMLKPEWGVDMIVGGHSHTIMDQPAQVNGILIAQAGIGSDQIGRFDIVVDDDTNSIVDWKWSLIEINDQTAKPDVELEKFIAEYKESTDKKFGTLICRLARKLTHPSRSCETELGNLFADILAFYAQSDVALLNGGSIRKIAVGPVLNLGELKSLYPYDDSVLRMRIRGSMLQHIFDYALAQECRPQRYLQISKGARLVFAEDKQKVVSFKLNDVAINGETEYTVCLTGYFFANSEKLLGIRKENIEEAGNVEVVSTSIRDLIEEYFRSHQNLDSKVEGRIVFS